MLVYKLTFCSGKSYIGQTVRMLNVRITQHRARAAAGSLLPVHCAWRKHGDPSVSVLGEYSNMEELHAAEIAAVAEHGTLSPAGYNVSRGGDTAPSKSPEVASKIAEKARGRTVGEETKAKISKASIGFWSDPSYREKVSAALKASWTPEMREALSARARAAKGAKRSEAAKENMRGRVVSEETRAKMSASAKARVRAKFSMATCDKISDRVRESWRNPDISARRSSAISAAHKAKFADMSAEDRATFSEIRKRAWETRRAKQAMEGGDL